MFHIDPITFFRRWGGKYASQACCILTIATTIGITATHTFDAVQSGSTTKIKFLRHHSATTVVSLHLDPLTQYQPPPRRMLCPATQGHATPRYAMCHPCYGRRQYTGSYPSQWLELFVKKLTQLVCCLLTQPCLHCRTQCKHEHIACFEFLSHTQEQRAPANIKTGPYS